LTVIRKRIAGLRKFLRLLDELHLFVFPLVVGSGKRLFGTPGDQLALKLLDSATFGTGVVHLTYTTA
jgi:dihydrofolate reductase